MMRLYSQEKRLPEVLTLTESLQLVPLALTVGLPLLPAPRVSTVLSLEEPPALAEKLPEPFGTCGKE